MPREYRTIEEAAGPLLLVKDVENVTYGELAEIRLSFSRMPQVSTLRTVR